MNAGVAKRDITPDKPVRLITGLMSTGVHDRIYARSLVLDDGQTSLAIVTLDIPVTTFEFTDKILTAITDKTGIEHTLINSSHTHSGVAESEELMFDMILEAVEEAQANRCPVSLHTGRAPVQVGYNRRIMDDKGQVSMGVNKEGAVVPWVNTLTIRRLRPDGGKGIDGIAKGSDMAVLFEHAAHPVIVHSASSLITGDFPAHAIQHLERELGDDVMPIFAQGCGANINGHPLNTGHEEAEKAGRKLGDAVLAAMKKARRIEADKLDVKSGQVMLPCQPLPSIEVLNETRELLKTDFENQTESGKPVTWVTEEVYQEMSKSLDERQKMIERGEESLPRRFDATAVMIGTEWCLVAMHDEMFCEYELWVDEAAPFETTMTFGYTNGGSGYVATDEALAMGAKGGYEAGTFPCWWAHGTYSINRNTPAVGTERLIRECVSSLWK